MIRDRPRQIVKQTYLVIIGERDLFTRFSDRLTDDEIVPSLFGVLESLSAIDKDICSNGHSLQIRKRQSNTGQLAETKWQRAIPIREKMEVHSDSDFLRKRKEGQRLRRTQFAACKWKQNWPEYCSCQTQRETRASTPLHRGRATESEVSHI